MTSRWKRWWSTAVGMDGRPVPVPPDWHTSTGETIGLAMVLAAGLTALLLCSLVVSLVLSLLAGDLRLGSADFFQRIGLAAAICIAGGISATGLGLLIALAFWPWSRRSLGVALENRVQELSPEELDAEIRRREIERTRAADRDRKRHDAYCDWLIAQRERRRD